MLFREKHVTARSGSIACIRPHPGSFEVAGVLRSYPHSEEVLRATQELIDRILRFSTSFESTRARIS
jgi:hypothetical protein